jgi:hypothetical protein
MINIATSATPGTALNDGDLTATVRCAWTTVLAPLDIALRLRGIGSVTASGNVIVSYRWANLTASGSSTALLEDRADTDWQVAMTVDMNSETVVVRQVTIPVEGKHLAVRMENSTGGCVSAISLAVISRITKAG